MDETIQKKEPAIAAVFSFFIAGTGQMYCGEVGRGVGFLVGAIIGYIIFVVPGIIISIWAVVDAYQLANEKNREIDNRDRKKKQVEKNKTTSSDFVKNLKKIYLLFQNEILSEEEYVNKKNALIANLYKKTIMEDPEDFLSSIIILKDENILDQDEIKKIKLIVY